MLAAGTLLDNRYSIDHQIGAGGFADVYQAWDHRLKRRVAVKVMLLNRLLSDQERELIRQGVDSHRRQQMLYERQQEFLVQFRQEAELVAGLDHPNILAVNDN